MEKPNMSYIDALSDGNISFKEMLVGIVKKELPEEIAVYQNNISCMHFKEAAENVHKLKHKISILGLVTSYQLAVQYEENLKVESTALQGEFEVILDKMIRYVNTL